MERFVIVGGTRLYGNVEVSGAKNAALPILAATLLTTGPNYIRAVPRISDVWVMQEVLDNLGAVVAVNGTEIAVRTGLVGSWELGETLVRKMRASNLVMGPLLSRFGHFRVPYPGGCAIGSRPMDLHLKGFMAMGAWISERAGFIEAQARELRGAEIHLDFPSVGATENLMMAATLAKGETVLANAAREPEIVDLAKYLIAAGAKIEGVGTEIIRIKGVKGLSGANHVIIPDRIETGTFMIAAAITRGRIKISNARASEVEPLTAKLREAGATVAEGPEGLEVSCEGRVKGVDVKTMPFPGFPTDMQPQMMALLASAEGTSVFSERVFENRFRHVGELLRMGANITVDGRVAVIKGVKKLSGAWVEASDLRAGAALILAGLVADDETVVENIEHIDRGYDDIEQKFCALGAKITRVRD